MVRPRTYHDRTSTSLSFEKQMLNEFLELCRTERKSISEKVTEMIQQELEKNVIGLNNPINVGYQDSSLSKGNNTLDSYIDKGFVTVNHFQQDFKQKENERLERYAALGKTIAKAAEQIIYFKKNGKYQIQ
ncbi:MAG TPA: hypothetical protein VLE44_00215 [Candidatus Saccharimonadales bacterium]|nr:hypothetical protein [Candidatus Saccharimonadales bacterium]